MSSVPDEVLKLLSAYDPFTVRRLETLYPSVEEMLESRMGLAFDLLYDEYRYKVLAGLLKKASEDSLDSADSYLLDSIGRAASIVVTDIAGLLRTQD